LGERGDAEQERGELREPHVLGWSRISARSSEVVVGSAACLPVTRPTLGLVLLLESPVSGSLINSAGLGTDHSEDEKAAVSEQLPQSAARRQRYELSSTGHLLVEIVDIFEQRGRLRGCAYRPRL
jgi:hypothetical protein